MRQVISISPEGAMSGLQRKPGQGLDLRQFGNAQIERVSEIEFHEEAQRWYVHVLRGPFAGCTLTHALWRVHVGSVVPEGFDGVAKIGASSSATFLFPDYDDAVRAEVTFLDAARAQGHF